jgi:hypothetical protein
MVFDRRFSFQAAKTFRVKRPVLLDFATEPWCPGKHPTMDHEIGFYRRNEKVFRKLRKDKPSRGKLTGIKNISKNISPSCHPRAF